ncbi:MAG: GGDEF domain-containing protein, partial [Gammaproteobacteria bacterium]|nr:GGDEF domain-containing protein [Gammaproteobacteria bacterium]
KRLKQAVRAVDTVARIGGDEFVVLLEELHTEDAVAQVAEQIIDGLHQPCNVKGYAAKLTGSIGAAVYPDDGKTSDELLSFSDKVMYKAKKSGKDKFLFSG